MGTQVVKDPDQHRHEMQVDGTPADVAHTADRRG
jgi:hypothetical protein